MKHFIPLMMAAALMISCGQGEKKENLVNGDSVNQIINQKDAEINNLLGTVNDIQDGLRQITEAQGRINTLRQGGQEGVAADDIREQMAFIQRTMEQNKQRMSELQKQLDNANINAKNLRQTIASLQQQLDDKSTQIAALKDELARKDAKIQQQAEEISALNSHNANLSQANEAKARTISQQDKDLNRGWYVFGTKRELKDNGILHRGDVLPQSFNRSYLTEVDIRKVHSIPLQSKSAKILTNHPASSYTLEKDADKKYTLQIIDPASFWSISRYLVIQVK